MPEPGPAAGGAEREDEGQVLHPPLLEGHGSDQSEAAAKHCPPTAVADAVATAGWGERSCQNFEERITVEKVLVSFFS